MTVSKLLGVVPIKMFDSGQTLDYSSFGFNYANFQFEAQSTDPMLYSLAVNNGALLGMPDNFASEIMGVLGASSMTVNPTGLGIGGNAQTYIDGVVYYDASLSSGKAALFYKSQPRPSGNWNSLPFSSYQLSDALDYHAALPSCNGANTYPVMNVGKKAIAAFWTAVPGDDPVGAFRMGYVTPGGLVPVARILGEPDFSIAGQWKISCRNPVETFGIDNYILCGGNPGNTLIASYSSIDPAGSFNMQEVTMDSMVLNPVFQILNNSEIKGYGKGFIAPLVVNGAGVTRQYCEVCVFLPDMSGYYILALEPMDAGAAAQLGRNSGIPQVKIDSDGIIWFNSGNIVDLHKILYSFSSGFNFPVYYFGNLQPITLPCFVDSMALGLYA